jgi:AraC-like DNA-binding protein/DNA-binding NarL/FixJ family response regulator
MKEQTLEGQEQLNSLHFQMLQLITRISEMQSTLENPEAKAVLSVNERMGLNDKGEVSLPQIAESELTYEIKPREIEATNTSKKFVVVFIDDNESFLGFIQKQLQNIYDLRIYNDIAVAAEDIKVMMADLVVCKQDMLEMTGSELCNAIKTTPTTERTKFILMTDYVMTPQDMKNQNITLAADDMLAKPFNIQEAVMRFNKVLGIAPIELDHNVIEGGETRMLESQNSSMTTSTFYFDESENRVKETTTDEDIANKSMTEEMPMENTPDLKNDTALSTGMYGENETIGDYSMNNVMDQQLMHNIEQYVLHNMSRGNISLDELATAMGMGRVPFFHKVRNITTKTPTEVIRDLRLKHACTLLVRTNINMNELAANVGFKTAENFATAFKEKFGIMPLEYRLRHRKD